MQKAWVLNYPLSAQRRLWSDWADAQADLSLCWTHSHFVGFVMLWSFWKLSLSPLWHQAERMMKPVSSQWLSGIWPAVLLSVECHPSAPHTHRFLSIKYVPRHEKTNKMSVRPVKTPISLGIHPVWSESSLCTQWVAKGPRFLHADSDDSDQTGGMPRLIWVFAGCTLTLLKKAWVLSYPFSAQGRQISLGIHPVWSVFAVRMKKAWVLSYPLSAQRRLWSDWPNAQAYLSLRWAHSHFVHFVMLWFICSDLQTSLGKQCWPRSDASVRNSPIKVYPVCHSICIFLMQYSTVY